MNTDIAIISNADIKSKIFTIRGMQVMLDSDLAEIFSTETRRLNEQVKRNVERFPQSFCFQLTDTEFNNLKSHFATSSLENPLWGGRRKLPFAFTEHGIAMLPAVLKSEIATKMSVQIINAFVAMRHFIADNAGVFQRLERVEAKLLNHDEKLDKIFTQRCRKQNICCQQNGWPYNHQGTFRAP